MSDINKEAAAEPQEQAADAFEEELQEVEAEAAEIEQSADELNRLLAEAKARADETHDRLMRAHAEMENLKRRHSQELEKAHKFALEKFVAELLGVRDSLELGFAAAQDENADVARLREGTELTLKMLADVMSKFHVEQLDPVGQPFDPEYHQAMATVPRSDVEADTVVDVIQKGYTLNGRLVRPALVAVSKVAEGDDET